jgi:hypothetical protein
MDAREENNHPVVAKSLYIQGYNDKIMNWWN